MRLINADDLPISSIDMTDVGYHVSKYGQGIPAVYLDDIKDAPTIDPERKTGRWIELTNTNHTYICSICGRMLVNITDGKNMVSKNYPYCHCGADMRGEQE